MFQTALGTRHSDGHWETSLLGSYHNAKNAVEKQRLKLEHPGEVACVTEDRVLGAIAVTRGMPCGIPLALNSS